MGFIRSQKKEWPFSSSTRFSLANFLLGHVLHSSLFQIREIEPKYGMHFPLFLFQEAMWSALSFLQLMGCSLFHPLCTFSSYLFSTLEIVLLLACCSSFFSSFGPSMLVEGTGISELPNGRKNDHFSFLSSSTSTSVSTNGKGFSHFVAAVNTTAASNRHEESYTRTHIFLIVAIVMIGVLLFIILPCLILWYLYDKKKQLRRLQDQFRDQYGYPNPVPPQYVEEMERMLEGGEIHVTGDSLCQDRECIHSTLRQDGEGELVREQGSPEREEEHDERQEASNGAESFGFSSGPYRASQYYRTTSLSQSSPSSHHYNNCNNSSNHSSSAVSHNERQNVKEHSGKGEEEVEEEEIQKALAEVTCDGVEAVVYSDAGGSQSTPRRIVFKEEAAKFVRARHIRRRVLLNQYKSSTSFPYSYCQHHYHESHSGKESRLSLSPSRRREITILGNVPTSPVCGGRGSPARVSCLSAPLSPRQGAPQAVTFPARDFGISPRKGKREEIRDLDPLPPSPSLSPLLVEPSSSSLSSPSSQVPLLPAVAPPSTLPISPLLIGHSPDGKWNAQHTVSPRLASPALSAPPPGRNTSTSADAGWSCTSPASTTGSRGGGGGGGDSSSGNSGRDGVGAAHEADAVPPPGASPPLTASPPPLPASSSGTAATAENGRMRMTPSPSSTTSYPIHWSKGYVGVGDERIELSSLPPTDPVLLAELETEAAEGPPEKLQGLPIEVRVRPRRHLPRGKVVLLTQNAERIELRFRRDARIPHAAPPPLNPEDRAKLLAQLRRVASPIAYGRASYTATSPRRRGIHTSSSSNSPHNNGNNRGSMSQRALQQQRRKRAASKKPATIRGGGSGSSCSIRHSSWSRGSEDSGSVSQEGKGEKHAALSSPQLTRQGSPSLIHASSSSSSFSVVLSSLNGRGRPTREGRGGSSSSSSSSSSTLGPSPPPRHPLPHSERLSFGVELNTRRKGAPSPVNWMNHSTIPALSSSTTMMCKPTTTTSPRFPNDGNGGVFSSAPCSVEKDTWCGGRKGSGKEEVIATARGVTSTKKLPCHHLDAQNILPAWGEQDQAEVSGEGGVGGKGVERQDGERNWRHSSPSHDKNHKRVDGLLSKPTVSLNWSANRNGSSEGRGRGMMKHDQEVDDEEEEDVGFRAAAAIPSGGGEIIENGSFMSAHFMQLTSPSQVRSEFGTCSRTSGSRSMSSSHLNSGCRSPVRNMVGSEVFYYPQGRKGEGGPSPHAGVPSLSPLRMRTDYQGRSWNGSGANSSRQGYNSDNRTNNAEEGVERDAGGGDDCRRTAGGGEGVSAREKENKYDGVGRIGPPMFFSSFSGGGGSFVEENNSLRTSSSSRGSIECIGKGEGYSINISNSSLVFGGDALGEKVVNGIRRSERVLSDEHWEERKEGIRQPTHISPSLYPTGRAKEARGDEESSSLSGFGRKRRGDGVMNSHGLLSNREEEIPQEEQELVAREGNGRRGRNALEEEEKGSVEVSYEEGRKFPLRFSSHFQSGLGSTSSLLPHRHPPPSQAIPTTRATPEGDERRAYISPHKAFSSSSQQPYFESSTEEDDWDDDEEDGEDEEDEGRE